MRKNGYSKEILMLLAGLSSICYCSAMERDQEKSKSTALVRERKALTPKKSKSTALVNVLKRKKLGLELNPEQQMTFDKKFGIVNPRKAKGDIIPTMEQLREIFKTKIEPLYFNSFDLRWEKLKQNKKFIDQRDQSKKVKMITDSMFELTNYIRKKRISKLQ